MGIQAHRYHDISCGHRVVEHESKCQNLHGHNYRVHFFINGELDALGRVLDFSVIKSALCMWLEDNWDHRMLIWLNDPWLKRLQEIDPTICVVPFNPTAENMAGHLLRKGPELLPDNVVLEKVVIEETRKCGVTAYV